MSRAGKFIPGQGRNKTKTEPVKGAGAAIRASTDTVKPASPGAPAESRGRFGIKTLGRPVDKKQRLPILLASVLITALIVGGGGYFLVVKPSQDKAARIQDELDKEKAQHLADEQKAAEEKRKAEAAALLATTAKANIHVICTNPNAVIEINGVKVPASESASDTNHGFAVNAGMPIKIKVHVDGFEDYIDNQPGQESDSNKYFGPYTMVPNHGTISLSCDLQPVKYELAGPIGVGDAIAPVRTGVLPARFEQLPEGHYTCTAKYEDWELKPVSITVHDKDDINQQIVFPFATFTLSSNPPGALVREGRNICGKTPMTLDHQRPGKHSYTLDYPLRKVVHVTLDVPDAGNIKQNVDLPATKDFKNSSDMIMVWLEDQNYWVGKYEVTQEQYTKIMGENPSFSRLPGHPVDSVSWDEANEFCRKLNDSDKAANMLPAGYHYDLPSELEWATFNDDSKMSTSALSMSGPPFEATQPVGFSEPNSYGLYDTLGNVQEWCRDLFGVGQSRSIRGGDWLSSIGNFSSSATRVGAPQTYKDKFTGFRVILEKDNP